MFPSQFLTGLFDNRYVQILIRKVRSLVLYLKLKSFKKTSCVALIGYLKVTWHHYNVQNVCTRLWEGNIAKNLWRQRVTVQCYPRSWPLSEIYVHNFVHGVKGFLHRLYNKSFFDCSLGNLLNFVSLKYKCLSRFPLGKHWDSRETKLTVFLGISNRVLITWLYRLRITPKTIKKILYFYRLSCLLDLIWFIQEVCNWSNLERFLYSSADFKGQSEDSLWCFREARVSPFKRYVELLIFSCGLLQVALTTICCCSH